LTNKNTYVFEDIVSEDMYLIQSSPATLAHYSKDMATLSADKCKERTLQ